MPGLGSDLKTKDQEEIPELIFLEEVVGIVKRVLVEHIADGTVEFGIMLMHAVRAFEKNLNAFGPEFLEILNGVF